MLAVKTIFRNERRLQWSLLAFMALYYGCILSDIGLGPPAIPLDLTFNSMLAHLLHGEFFVDPATVGDEGFLRNGHVYAYWGIWCALLRLPLWLVRRLDLDMTTWSCLAAVCLAAAAKIRTLLFLRATVNNPAVDKLYKLMLLYLVFGGSEIAFLKASIFQEIVFWAAAFGAIFVYFAVIGLVRQNFSRRTLSAMALSAGLALLTRVSTGIGLCVAFLLLLLVLTFERPAANRTRLILPLVLLAALMTCAGIVNYFRWGNPATFADHTLYLMNRYFPDRMPRTRQYGYFNIARIPFGLLYYFLPLWVLAAGGGGSLLFEATQTRLMDAVELPPSSFFLTDLLPILFLAILLLALFRRQAQHLLAVLQCLALASGLVIPCLLMLTAISMNYRYRMEFYPLLDLLAFLGLYVTVVNPTYALRAQRHLRWFQLATTISILAAFAEMILYKLSVFGPATQLLRRGLVQYYLT